MFSGSPVQILSRTIVLRLLLGLLLVPLAALTGWGAVASLADKPPEFLGAGILGAIALASASGFWLFVKREGSRTVRVFEEGIEAMVGGRRTALRWSEIKEVWFEAIRVQAGGLIGAAVGAAITAARSSKTAALDATSTNMTVRLMGRGGEKILLTSNDKGVVRAFETVLAKVNPGLLVEARRLVQSGQSADFGPVSLSLRGVSRGGKAPLAISEIERLAIESGKLRLKKKGAWLDTFSIPIKTIPNVFVLTDLYSEMATGLAAGSPALAGGNLVQGRYV